MPFYRPNSAAVPLVLANTTYIYIVYCNDIILLVHDQSNYKIKKKEQKMCQEKNYYKCEK